MPVTMLEEFKCEALGSRSRSLRRLRPCRSIRGEPRSARRLFDPLDHQIALGPAIMNL